MVYVRLLTFPPIALGAWSMALVLWQPPEYYLFYVHMYTASHLGIIYYNYVHTYYDSKSL